MALQRAPRRPAASRLGIILALCLLATPAVAAAAAAPGNALAGHPSPYLRLHADDPVAWQEWSPAVLERARRENRLVYVSVGYFSCHWCHVMQRESYKNPAIAQYLNDHFIPVKVDRELEPALDARLIAFAEATRGMAGWPLNVFLTPEGYPLYAMLYAPPQEFRAALERLQGLWAQDAGKLRELARAAAAKPSLPASPPPRQPAGAYARKLVTGALAAADTMHGGFGEESKFPSVPQLEFLLAYQARRPHPELEAFLRLTLDQMSNAGLMDHLGGGFFRYSVDPGWKTPHFEKMLYDNALLARLYLRAARVLNHAPYEAVARRTLDFMLRELRHPSGGFLAALSAVDEQGVEGGYYLWDLEELQALLTPAEYEAFRHAYGLTDPPAFEHGYLPIPRDPAAVASTLGREPAALERLLADARHKLLAARARRGLPRDTKQLAGWNGLALAAFAEAARTTGEERYREAARGVRDYLLNTLWDGRVLRRAVHEGRAVGAVSLEDYAYVASGLLEWAQLSGRREDFRQAAAVATAAWQRFYGADGWRLSEDAVLAGSTAEAALADGTLPSPSAVLIEVSLRLAAERGERALGAKAREALARARAQVWEDPFWYATYVGVLLAQEEEHRSTQRRAVTGHSKE